MKEAEQKANELVIKYQILLGEDMTNYRVFGTFTDKAKQCALICVEEILNDNPNIYDSDRLNHGYWQEVKQIIKNK